MIEVMQSVAGSVRLSNSETRYARLHRNGQVTYRAPSGNWHPASARVAATFQSDELWSVVTRAELAAYAEEAAR